LAMSIDDQGVDKQAIIDMLNEGGAVEIKERVNLNEEEFEDTVIN